VSKQRFLNPFIALVVTAGAVVGIFCAYRLNRANLDVPFLLLVLVSVVVGSRLIIHIPRIRGEITVTDTLIFLTLLMYGGEAAVLLAAIATLATSLRVTRKIKVILFNSAVMSCATFGTVEVLGFGFGSIHLLSTTGQSATFITALCLMASVQYVVNTFLVTIYTGCKMDQAFWQTWRTHYLWASLTYFVGASAAFILAKLIGVVGFYALIGLAPIIATVYFTYKTYLTNVEASSEKVEVARRHVEELSNYNAEQVRIREQFNQLEKMSALGQLASGVAHDFNNTLAGILGRAELMLIKVTDPEIERGLNIIIKAAGDGAHTVKRIQDFARQRRDHDFVHVAIDQILIDVNEITRPRWKNRAQAGNIHINLNLHIDSNAVVMGDASELREVLVNMVFNAVDAMPEGGRLTLSAEQHDGLVEISVSDTGIGMDQEVRSRIFDPFFTTKGNAGMGMGLAVSYGIIQRHQGNIEVESEPARGTTFRIKLPVAELPAVAEIPVEPPAPLKLVSNSNLPKLLVVDDEASLRELLAEILESEGYEVTLAEGGAEALALFNTGTYGAVFTDVGMPGMSGWELARAIRELDSQIPIAVVTGWGDAVGSAEQENAKVDWVVTKPFFISEIIEIIGEISLRLSKQGTQLSTGTYG
jgi:signal transduction histidine kinase/ActR/RegA family two-component response regulator